MRRCIHLCTFFLALMLTLSLSLKAQAAEIPTISGQGVLDLVKANKGKVVFINVFATWCPPCREELPGIKKIRTKYPEDKVLIVSISVDENKGKLKNFVDKMQFNYPVYVADDSVSQLFGISSIPFNMLYDRNGKLVAAEAGMLDEDDLAQGFDEFLK